ncbi:hypothetical protein RND71_039746 [Anisodus tanguticus]|uniref:Uncharacterized protein n=1 Tax=Anisodus tanguticus TaxID=243964 RepID=A0AAE1UY25_9SOLA|nr:hypothetical protein RND71_039746 [Anisodus tanguticus]
MENGKSIIVKEFNRPQESYVSLFNRLEATEIVYTINTKESGYRGEKDMTKSCAYHPKTLGHDIEECQTFMNKVKDLIEMGQIKIELLTMNQGGSSKLRTKDGH